MIEKVIACYTNPVKSRILTTFNEVESEHTAKSLSEKNPEIPQATLYRHLKSMVNDEILEIVAERKVRNVVEKTYRVAIDTNKILHESLANNNKQAYYAITNQLLIGIDDEFKAYSKREDANIMSDGSGAWIMPFYATVEELTELATEICEVTLKYFDNEPTEERQLRSMAVIYTPPKK